MSDYKVTKILVFFAILNGEKYLKILNITRVIIQQFPNLRKVIFHCSFTLPRNTAFAQKYRFIVHPLTKSETLLLDSLRDFRVSTFLNYYRTFINIKFY